MGGKGNWKAEGLNQGFARGSFSVHGGAKTKCRKYSLGKTLIYQ